MAMYIDENGWGQEEYEELRASIDKEKAYDNWIDERYAAMRIGDVTFKASQVLKELNSTAYIVGYNEWEEELDVYE